MLAIASSSAFKSLPKDNFAGVTRDSTDPKLAAVVNILRSSQNLNNSFSDTSKSNEIIPPN